MSLFSDIAKVALPIAGEMFGGPIGAMAGNMVAGAIGGEDKKDGGDQGGGLDLFKDIFQAASGGSGEMEIGSLIGSVL